MKHFLLQLHAVLALGLYMAAAARAHEESAADDMADAANQLLVAFPAEERGKLVFPMNDDHRLAWHFVPMERKGVALKEMTPQQQHLTTALLASGLSSQGLLKASNIMALEQVLQAIEGPSRRFPRDPQQYHVSIFGEPGPKQTWGFRFEGHHLSLSFTIAEGKHISCTPSMMGANPAIVRQGPHRGLQVLAEEEALGRQLAKSLSAEQRAMAILSDTAPDDIVTGNQRKITPLSPHGIGWSDLDKEQRRRLWRLVKTYVRRMRGPIAEADLNKIREAGRETIHFAWAGGVEPGQRHYYRIQGATFLVEYDNTQNDANHIHTVYRDFSEDFGEDLLTKHYHEEHGEAQPDAP